MKIKNRVFRENMAAYLLLSPGIILFLTMGLFTVGFSILISFYNFTGVDFLKTAKFVGLDNYKSLLTGRSPLLTEAFYLSLFNNFKIAFFSLLFIIPISLVLAFLILRAGRLTGILRTLFFIPMITTGVATYYTWIGILSPDGLLNSILKALKLDFHIFDNGLLGDPRTALAGIIITVIWGGIPGAMILYYAGLLSIDSSLYEAAAIDGANKFKVLTKITWPLLKPITIVCIFNILNTSFQAFENVFILTRGGPANSTSIVGLLVYNLAFSQTGYDNMGPGVASAAGWFVFVITLGLSLLSLKVFKTDY